MKDELAVQTFTRHRASTFRSRERYLTWDRVPSFFKGMKIPCLLAMFVPLAHSTGFLLLGIIAPGRAWDFTNWGWRTTAFSSSAILIACWVT